MGLVLLHKTREGLLSLLSAVGGYNEKTAVCKQGRGLSPKP